MAAKTKAKKAAKKPAKQPPKKAKISKVSKVAAKTVKSKPNTKASRPSHKPEPPPIDHNATLGPLYLGAGHGHLARTVDKQWLDAIRRYRDTLAKAIDYEAKRSAPARATMVINFARQLQTLMNNLAARVQAVVAEASNPDGDPTHKAHAKTSGKTLVGELQELNKTLGDMVGPDGMAPHGDLSLPLGQPQTLEQLQRSYFNNIARWADLERALG